MSNTGFINDGDSSKKEKNSASPKRTSDIIGKVTGTIGSGENAKNSIVYLTIKYSFVSGVIISIFIIINSWIFRENEKTPDFFEEMANIWNIVIPVITLALGYAFGKSSK